MRMINNNGHRNERDIIRNKVEALVVKNNLWFRMQEEPRAWHDQWRPGKEIIGLSQTPNCRNYLACAS